MKNRLKSFLCSMFFTPTIALAHTIRLKDRQPV